MKPTIAVMLMALVLYACSPLQHLQKVESQIPTIGSIGSYRSGLFKKDFQKVGEPVLDTPISVSIQTVGFTPSMKTKYAKYLEAQAQESKVEFKDSMEVQPRYYQMQITDVVGLSAQLNNEANNALRNYIQDDQGLEVLTSISFISNTQFQFEMRSAEQYAINTQNGELVLEFRGGGKTNHFRLASLQIFDFDTSSFCWKRNKRGQLEIAHILMDGNSCPGETKSDPNKLDPILDYSKL